MVKHALFLRWLLIVAIICIGSFFAHHVGIFVNIHEVDTLFISHTIIAGFVLMTGWCGIKTYNLSKQEAAGENLPHTENLEELGWFASGTFTALGMFGTIVGMIMALNGLGTINVSDVLSMQTALQGVIRGMGIALYTTGVGIVCAKLLEFQYINLGHARRNKENEKKLC